MIDKIIKLSNGYEFCVLDELDLDDKKYIIAFQIENDEVLKNFIVSEVKTNLDGKITVFDIEDNKTFEKVSDMFLKRMAK